MNPTIPPFRALLCVASLLGLVSCKPTPDTADIQRHANAVRNDARQAEIERGDADRPEATQADGVDYKEARDKLAATLKAAKSAGVADDVLETSRQLGESEGRKIAAKVSDQRQAWQEKNR